MQETRVQFLGQEDPLEKEMATHSFTCLENPMDRGAWRATVHGVVELDTNYWLNHHYHHPRYNSSPTPLGNHPPNPTGTSLSTQPHWDILILPIPLGHPYPPNPTGTSLSSQSHWDILIHPTTPGHRPPNPTDTRRIPSATFSSSVSSGCPSLYPWPVASTPLGSLGTAANID